MLNRLKILAVMVLVATAASCATANATPDAPPGGGAVATPVALDTAAAGSLAQATRPNEPLQILFDWTLQDREAKFGGKGVVRMQAPYRARLDLFVGPDIEVLRAALLEGTVDVVHGGPGVPIPPVEFLWSVLGVFRAPGNATMSGLTREGNGLSLSFTEGTAKWRFVSDGATLRSAEWRADDGGRRTVELTGPFRFGRPSKAVFRDWREFRELVLTVTSVEKVEPFGPETWNVANR